MEKLEKHLSRPIKEVITEFPSLVDILNEYDIGCGACMVGTCLFKDIVSIHSLSPEVEKEMMARLADAISPLQPGTVSAVKSFSQPQAREKNYSPGARYSQTLEYAGTIIGRREGRYITLEDIQEEG